MSNQRILALAAATGLSMASLAGATTLGINFSGGSSESPVNVTGTAGAVPQTNWNNVAGIGNTTNNLVDSTGTPTSVSVTTIGNNTWNDAEPVDGGNGSLLRDFLDGGSGGQDQVNVSLPANSTYSVYVYFASNQNSTADFTINGTTYYAVNQSNFSDGLLYPVTPSLTPANAQQGNYFVVNGLSGPLTIIADANTIGDFRSSLDGIQIVGTIPEPASLGFLGLASLGLLARRGRRA